jgi:DNA-binding transcriptional ArsR family regulator
MYWLINRMTYWRVINMSAHSKLEINAIKDALSATFAALADPTRRAMLTRLSQGEASVNELAAPFKMSLPAVSKHIKVLEKAGLLTKTRSAQQRPCKIDGVQLKQAVDWIAQYKQLWEGRLDRLDAYLLELKANENATESIAVEAINTPATAKNNVKKPVKSEKPPENMPKKPKFKLKISKTATQAKEKTNDYKDADNDLQQQIGFDF